MKIYYWKNWLLTLAVVAAINFNEATTQAAGGRLLGQRQRAADGQAKQRLGLTSEQKASIKEILKAERGNLERLLTQMHEARAGLRNAIHASGATEASVRQASAKVAAVEADLAVERLSLYGKISPLLTTEQRDKLAQLQAKLDERWEDAMDRWSERLEK